MPSYVFTKAVTLVADAEAPIADGKAIAALRTRIQRMSDSKAASRTAMERKSAPDVASKVAGGKKAE